MLDQARIQVHEPEEDLDTFPWPRVLAWTTGDVMMDFSKYYIITCGDDKYRLQKTSNMFYINLAKAEEVYAQLGQAIEDAKGYGPHPE